MAALASRGIALFEYLLQVPANRIGHTQFAIGELKILQEVITLLVFVPFAVFYMREPVRLNYLWAGSCLCAAVFFVFKRQRPAGRRRAPSCPPAARQRFARWRRM